MDQASAQTEKIATYETSRTRRSIVDGKIRSDDLNNDEEYATSGFYVREKTSSKKPDSTSAETKKSDKECKENGVSPQVNSTPSPVVNGEDSSDGESSKDSKKQDNTNKTEDSDKQSDKEDQSDIKDSESAEKDQFGSKEDIEPENDEISDAPKEQNEKKEENEAESDNAEEKEEAVDAETCNNSENSKSSEKNEVEKENDEEKKPNTLKEDAKEDKKNEEEEKDEEKETRDEEESSNKESDNTEKNETTKEKETDKQNKSEDDEKEEKGEAKEESIKDTKDKKENKEDEVKNTNVMEKEQSEGSILKDQLEKEKPTSVSEENMDAEMEMDEDFDPSLLCPDISMDVDEAPVNTESIPEDGNTSPLPYEATFSTLVDEITGAEVQVDLTPEEMELRQKMYGPNNAVQTTKIHCTACNIHLGSALTGANNRFVHPLLKVLICKNCYHFYTSGEFEKDEDGSELYCRWCGQGGQVLCCSSCEFVFCKRCIRNNFGPKKFKEIRDSDDWNCFRCDRGQLSNLRASCAEFMEYYRTELARAQSLCATNPELMTIDHTMCCKGGSEKKEETKTPVQPKTTRRKRKDMDDPDYHPVVEEDGEPPKKKIGTPTPSGGPGYTVIPPSVRPLVPKPPVGQPVRPVNTQQPQKPIQGQVFKVGNTTFRAKSPANGQGYTVQRPSVSQGKKSNSTGYTTIPPSAAPKTTSPGYITIPPSAAPKSTTPGYIKILPQRMQTPRPPTYTVVSGTSNGKPTFATVRAKQIPPMPPAMKHEWFEKTVRAAARVNSNLSYTLTQLNRQQSQASSVEALAMVHNKLQEVLSTSINSLIQIRKNLRTEFISGIKNIKFPPKPAPIPPTTGPIVVKDDDDVIFVSTPSNTPTTLPPLPPLVLSPSVTLTKKSPIQNKTDPFADPKPSTSGVSNKSNNANTPAKSTVSTVARGGFLKVRSFTSLQSVPAECITIPDDPPAAPDTASDAASDVKIIEEEDPLMITDEDKPKDDKEELPKSPEPSPEPEKTTSTPNECLVYNIKDDPTPAIKKMLSAFVVVKKSRVVDEIIRAQGLLRGKGKENVQTENGTEKKENTIEPDLLSGTEKENDEKENDEEKKGTQIIEKESKTKKEKTKTQSEEEEKKEDVSDTKEEQNSLDKKDKEDSGKSEENS